MKKRYFITLVLWTVINTIQAQTFEDFIQELNGLPLNQRQAVVDSFLTINPHSPLTESDTLAHFFYTGNAQSISVPGDATGWEPGINSMSHIDGTNFWYFTGEYENDARLDYKYVTNGSNWILDPRNPHSIVGGFGPNSELAMPGFVQPPEIENYPELLHGNIFDTIFNSQALGNSRHIKIYTPPNYDIEQDDYAVIVFHDGLDYLTLGNAKNVLDYLIGNDLIDPVIGVFVPAVNRNEEYHGNLKEEYTEFIITDVMGWVDSKYRTLSDPQFRAMAGASDGGNISLWIGMNHPEAFGKIAAYSSNVISQISSTFQNGPLLDLDIYLDIGTYDLSVLIPLVHDFRVILETKGYNYLFYEWHEGHSWGSWRAHIDNSLQFFFPHTNSVNDFFVDSALKLSQNYPNPTSSYTSISFSGRVGSNGKLSLLDESGKIISIIWVGKFENEIRQANIDVSRFKPGIYFCTLENEMKTVVRKLVIQ